MSSLCRDNEADTNWKLQRCNRQCLKKTSGESNGKTGYAKFNSFVPLFVLSTAIQNERAFRTDRRIHVYRHGPMDKWTTHEATYGTVRRWKPRRAAVYTVRSASCEVLQRRGSENGPQCCRSFSTVAFMTTTRARGVGQPRVQWPPPLLLPLRRRRRCYGVYRWSLSYPSNTSPSLSASGERRLSPLVAAAAAGARCVAPLSLDDSANDHRCDSSRSR